VWREEDAGADCVYVEDGEAVEELRSYLAKKLLSLIAI
jgi:hypothetical protein